MKIKIKPISVNEIFQGRRFKTKKYNDWREEMQWLLPSLDIPEGKLALILEVGFSSSGSDLDNSIKGIQDALQEKYGFNDSRIYQIIATKQVVKKGAEYIDISIEKYII